MGVLVAFGQRFHPYELAFRTEASTPMQIISQTPLTLKPKCPIIDFGQRWTYGLNLFKFGAEGVTPLLPFEILARLCEQPGRWLLAFLFFFYSIESKYFVKLSGFRSIFPQGPGAPPKSVAGSRTVWAVGRAPVPPVALYSCFISLRKHLFHLSRREMILADFRLLWLAILWFLVSSLLFFLGQQVTEQAPRVSALSKVSQAPAIVPPKASIVEGKGEVRQTPREIETEAKKQASKETPWHSLGMVLGLHT